MLTQLCLVGKFNGDLVFPFYIFLIFYHKFVLKNPNFILKK